MMKSRLVVAGQPGSTGASTGAMMSNDNIAMAGLGFAAPGVLWLLAKLIVGDLLPALSLTLAGIYIASDWLRARNILPQGLTDAIKPLGIPIAGATALFGLLHLFLAHVVLF